MFTLTKTILRLHYKVVTFETELRGYVYLKTILRLHYKVVSFEPELREYVYSKKTLLRLYYKVATFEPELREYVYLKTKNKNYTTVALQSCDFRAGASYF